MTPADTPRTERYHLRSCEVNSAYAPNTPRELIGTKMCDCGLDKAIDAYATARVIEEHNHLSYDKRLDNPILYTTDDGEVIISQDERLTQLKAELKKAA